MVLLVVLSVVQRRFIPKWDYPTHFSRTGRAVQGVYHEPKHSLDVLWLGASHMQNAASPMLLYQQTGIRSYNLATTGQPLPASYQILKNVLKEQSPKVVIIDVGHAMSGSRYQKTEPAWRKIIDSTPFAYLPAKLEMAINMVKLNPDRMDLEDVCSGVLPILRYHTNYNLEQIDYLDTHSDQVYAIKGQSCVGKQDAAPKDVWADYVAEEPNPKRIERLQGILDAQSDTLQKIADLCRKEHCDLVFTKVPVGTTRAAYSGYWDQEKHDLIQALADALGVPFIDTNYEDLGIDWKQDTCDKGMHLNMNGSAKFTDFFGKWLTDRYDFADTDSPELTMLWDAQTGIFNHEAECVAIFAEPDLQTYLNRLQNGNYTVFTAVAGTVGENWSKEYQNSLFAVLGSERNLWKRYNAGEESIAYAAIGSAGRSVGEVFNKKKGTLKGQLEDGAEYTVKSVNDGGVGTASIVINGEEMITEGDGIHFVVYDNDIHCVIDSATFDTLSKDCPVTHGKFTVTEFREGVLEYEYGALKELYRKTNIMR